MNDRPSRKGTQRHRQRGRAGVGARYTLGRLYTEFGDELVGLLDQNIGNEPHERAVHADGRFYGGTFEAAGAVAGITDCDLLAAGAKCDALVRISNFRRSLNQRDVMGLAVRLGYRTPNPWDLVATSGTRFNARSIAGFRSLMKAGQPPWWRKPDRIVAALLHRVSLPAIIEMKAAPLKWWVQRSSATYHGAHTFHLTRTQAGVQSAVPFRFRWEPYKNNPPMRVGQARHDDNGPWRFALYLDLIRPDWNHRHHVTVRADGRAIVATRHAGDLVVEEPQAPEEPVLFLPTRMPPGIDTESSDEILFAREGAYAVSFARRSSQGQQ